MTRLPKDKAALVEANRQAEGSHQPPIGCKNCFHLAERVRELTMKLEIANIALEQHERRLRLEVSCP